MHTAFPSETPRTGTAFGTKRPWLVLLAALLVLAALPAFPRPAQAGPYRVLAVMSYTPAFPWTKDVMEGIEGVLKGKAEITWFHMDTKRDLKGGAKKAEEAFELYKKLKPDGVIACDDNAQSLFVVPYLADKVDTPVMFCGVNGDPGQYGYPASNVSGVRERLHLAESVAFAQQLDPSIQSICYMTKKSPTAEGLRWEVERLKNTLPAESLDYRMPETMEQALADARDMAGYCDLLFVASMEGIPDAQGRAVPDAEAMPAIARAFGKPTTGTSSYSIKLGLLCAVVKTGQEQGRLAASKLLEAMSGTPVKDIPVGANVLGKRVINVTEMLNLNISPKPSVLKGAELTRIP